MIRYAYSLPIALLVAFCSCKKDSYQKPDLAPIAVTFKVSGNFSFVDAARSTPAASPARSLSETINYLYYFAFDADGNPVSNRSFQLSDPDFGSIRDVLEAGSYHIVVVGLKGENIFTESTVFNRIGLMVKNPEEEVFLATLNLDISEDAPSHEVVLKRMTSLLNVEFDETIPESVTRIEVAMANEYDRLNLSSGQVDASVGSGATKGKPKLISRTFIQQEDRVKPSLKIPMLNTVFPVSISIKAYNASKLVKQVRLSDVLMLRNTRYTLSGKLFRPVDVAAGVVIDEAWENEVTMDFP